ncbi:hypothetical protein cypCar_00021246, partial [Cyprinus carpio]
LKLRQSFEESGTHENNQYTDICRYSNGQQETPEQQHKPSLEETVGALLKRLREKRQALGLPDNMKGTKQEKNLVKPLYDRYQMVKHLLCVTPTITTIEEEEGSDDDSVRSELLECLHETRAEKKRRRKAIREFEEQFLRQMGRKEKGKSRSQ